MAKLFSNSQWDHVGIVIRHPATGELLFLEADFGGVKLRNLAERVKRSKSNEIAVRTLSVVRNSSMRENLYAFAQEMVGRPYEIGKGSFMVRVSDPLAKQEKERLNALLLDKEAQLEDISKELSTAALSNFQSRLLQAETERVMEQCQKIRARLEREFDANSLIENANQDSSVIIPGDQNDLSRVFCSELVAAAYQRVGLLGSYPPPFHYGPKDFSSEQTHPPGVHLLKSARLGKEAFIRKSARTAMKLPDPSRRRHIRGVFEGDTPSRESRGLIRDALKRTPLYEQVPDEYKRNHLLKSFRARVLEPGDVVFEQGQYGNKFYVVASGKVERYCERGDADPILVSTLGSRTSFGLTAFTYLSPRVSTVRARERTLLWELDRPTFELFQDSSSDIKSITSIADTRALRRLLSEHFLFKRLDKLGPKEMNSFFLVKFRAGEDIFSQGDAGDNFYIIKSGEFERHIRRPRSNRNGDVARERHEDEKDVLVKTLHPGQSFGELSLMYNAPRAATMRARTDAECWAISTESYHRLNLGGGTQRLRAIFRENASVERNGEPYMTREDLLRFTGIDSFPDEDRQRLSKLLVALVASNREQDPIAIRDRVSTGDETRLDSTEDEDQNGPEEIDDERILMSYWEFCRFDIVLNNPNAEMDFAFRLSDQTNSGFISLYDIESLLHEYADVDESAKEMVVEYSRLRNVFGRHGTRQLSMKEFSNVSTDILPPLFRKDLKRIMHHMLSSDLVGKHALLKDSDLDELSFIEPDGGTSVIGSQFVSSQSRQAARQNMLRAGSTYSRNTSSWWSGMEWGHLVSIAVSGAVSRSAVAPFERLKILMQTGGQSQFTRGWTRGFRSMVREDKGLLRALYRGNGANVIRIVPAALIQLAIVDRLRETRMMRNLMNPPNREAVPGASDLMSGGTRGRAVEAVLIGGIAGMVSAATTYPLDFIRGRLALQRKDFEPYRGAFHGLKEAIRTDGVKSIYRGLGPTLGGCFPYVGISFAMYESVRPMLPKRNDGSGIATTGSSIAAGAFASAVSQFASFPLDTCRHRMQVAQFDPRSQVSATSFIDTWREIGKQMGWRGYYRGIIPNLIKVAPASAVSFVAYEQVRGGMRVAEGAVDSFFAKPTPHVRSS